MTVKIQSIFNNVLTACVAVCIALQCGNVLPTQCESESKATCETSIEQVQRDPGLSTGNGGGGGTGPN